jgi:Family of unknown function (DUF6271)
MTRSNIFASVNSRSSLFYLPTHRYCSNSIRQLVREAAWAVSSGALRDATVCIIEHQLDSSATDRHREALLSSGTTRGMALVHFTEELKAAFVDRILAAAALPDHKRVRVREMLLPAGLSYGAGPNIAYLLASASRADLVHRRDSDIFFDGERAEDYPARLELLGMYGEWSTLPTFPGQERPPAPTEPVLVVGTGSFGAPTFDRRDLLTAGIEYLVKYQALGRPGVEVGDVASEAIDYIVEEPQRRYESDFFLFDEPGKIEMEACCLRGTFRILPEMPNAILGCDYLSKDIARQAGLPSLYHSRKVHHVYDANRARQADDRALVWYYIRDLQYIQMGRVWRMHNERVRSKVERFLRDGSLVAEAYAASFREAAEVMRSELVRVRVGAETVFRRASSVASGGSARRLRLLAIEVERLGPEIDEGVVTAVDDYCCLVETWSTLVDAAVAGTETLQSAVVS